jgi:hypothetical protein
MSTRRLQSVVGWMLVTCSLMTLTISSGQAGIFEKCQKGKDKKVRNGANPCQLEPDGNCSSVDCIWTATWQDGKCVRGWGTCKLSTVTGKTSQVEGSLCQEVGDLTGGAIQCPCPAPGQIGDPRGASTPLPNAKDC